MNEKVPPSVKNAPTHPHTHTNGIDLFNFPAEAKHLKFAIIGCLKFSFYYS